MAGIKDDSGGCNCVVVGSSMAVAGMTIIGSCNCVVVGGGKVAVAEMTMIVVVVTVLLLVVVEWWWRG